MDIPWIICKGKGINHKGCICEILWFFKVHLLGDRCIWHRPWHQFIIDGGWHELLAWGSSEQVGSPTNCVCQQNFVQHKVAVQQHWEGSNRHTAWVCKVPTLLFCRGSICHHWPQTAVAMISKDIACSQSLYSASCCIYASKVCISFINLVLSCT